MLKARNNYNDEEAGAYLRGFKEAESTEQEQKRRRAGVAGARAALCGYRKPTQPELKARNKYEDDEANAYLLAFKNFESTEQEQKLRHAKSTGVSAARAGVQEPTKQELKERHDYNDEEANAYLLAFKSAVGTQQEQRLRRVRANGATAARNGFQKPTEQELEVRGYSGKEIETYLLAFKGAVGNEQEQKLRRARTIGANAARAGFQEPTTQKLKARNKFNDNEAEAYILAFKNAAGTEQEQKLRRAKTIEANAARKRIQKSIPQELKARNNYDEDALKLRQARAAGANAARAGLQKPTPEELKERDYTDETANAYLQAYTVVLGDEQAQKLRKAKLEAEKAAKSGSDVTPIIQLMNSEESKTFLATFSKTKEKIADKAAKDKIENSRRAGAMCAEKKLLCPDADSLKNNRGYTDKQVEAYFDGYKNYNPENKGLKKRKRKET
jgi:hypothetical protein